MADRIQKTYYAEPGCAVTLDLERCSIQTETHDDPYVHIEIIRTDGGEGALEDDLKIIAEENDNDIRLDLKFNEHILKILEQMINPWRLSCALRVPASCNLNLKTTGGSITVADIDGMLDCKSSGGSLKIGHFTGPISARTSGGSITISGCEDRVEANTSGGSIRIGDTASDVRANTSGGGIKTGCIDGNVQAHTSGGPISIEEACGKVDAVSSGGSVSARLARQPDDHCRLETSGGSITAHVANDLALSLDARTSGGQVSCDIDVDGTVEKRLVRGHINDGGPELILRTSGGHVNVYQYTPEGANDE